MLGLVSVQPRAGKSGQAGRATSAECAWATTRAAGGGAVLGQPHGPLSSAWCPCCWTPALCLWCRARLLPLHLPCLPHLGSHCSPPHTLAAPGRPRGSGLSLSSGQGKGGVPAPHLPYPMVRRENPRLISTDEKAEARRGEGFCPGACQGHGQSKALGAEAALSDRSGPRERGVGREEGPHFPEAWDSKTHAWPGADGKAPSKATSHSVQGAVEWGGFRARDPRRPFWGQQLNQKTSG